MNRINKFFAIAAIAGVCSAVQPASALTTNLTTGTDGVGYSGNFSGGSYVLRKTLTGLEDWTSNDVLQVFNISSGSFVRAVGYQVVVPSTNSVSFHIGDGSSAGGYATNIALQTAGFGSSAPTVTATPTFQSLALTGSVQNVSVVTNGTVAVVVSPNYGVGKFYTANDTIDFTLPSLTPQIGAGLDVTVDLWVEVVDGASRTR